MWVGGWWRKKRRRREAGAWTACHPAARVHYASVGMELESGSHIYTTSTAAYTGIYSFKSLEDFTPPSLPPSLSLSE